MDNEYILEISNLCKSFPGVKALSNVNFKVKRGDVHGLVGENGAGKSTLVKILSGAYTADEGKVVFDGKEIGRITPVDAARIGISTVHQELRLVESLTVTENIFIGRPLMKNGMVDWQRMRKKAKELLDRMNIDINPNVIVSKLSVAKKQIVEVCKAVCQNAKLIIMDEPSATLTEKELNTLFGIIKNLKATGVTVIYISHRLEEIFQIADRVTVLRDGQHIATMDVKDTNRNQLISCMVGREITNVYPPKTHKPGEVLMSVKGLSRKGVLSDISFELRKGEILGIAGLVGAGRTELARAIFGLDAIDSGEIFINGRKVRIRNIKDAIKYRMALVPEERKLQGIVPELQVVENITLVGLKKFENALLINKKNERASAKEFVKRLRIVTPSLFTKIKNLSGGNQQKCVLAKWLLVDSDIFISDEPTRGIDVGAREEIYKLLDQLAANGKAIIMISSDLPEVIGMSDRILVMHRGRINATLDARDATQEKIMQYAID